MLCDKLNANNWPTTYISAEKCQTERLEALSKLKKYKCRVLVSTDLTARGIDVENVNLVINMDVPFDGETYLHRIGRAGRFGTFFLIAFL
jgi:ATP-dependent RNA helicase DDX20